MLFILPVLIVAASSIPVADFVMRLLDDRSAEVFQSIINSGFLRAAMVLTFTTLCFTFMLIFMPNTKVSFSPGFFGGLVTAILFLLLLKACAALQIGVARAGKIYGSFAIVPIILLWVYMSWQLILLGAEVAFAIQNCTTYRMEQGALKANFRARLLLSLAVVTETAVHA